MTLCRQCTLQCWTVFGAVRLLFPSLSRASSLHHTQCSSPHLIATTQCTFVLDALVHTHAPGLFEACNLLGIGAMAAASRFESHLPIRVLKQAEA